MPLDDILGIGKILPIDKLIDLVSKSVGRISKPYFDRKDINTRAYEIEKLAEARAKEMKIISEAVKENFQQTGGIEYKEEKLAISSPKSLEPSINIEPPITERTQDRLNFQEYKKQSNIESVTSFAADELKDEPPVNNEPVDEDWATRFFRIVEDVSNEDMQALWGKILAGEIKQPRTYSLRTLELIRNLSKHEAETFMKVANFAVKSGISNFLFKGKDDKILSEKHNVQYRDIAQLVEIGLIQPGDFVNYYLDKNPNDFQRVFTAGNIVFIIKVKGNSPKIEMPVHVFSNAGNELIKLIKPNPPLEYLSAIAKSIKNENIEIKYGYILGWEGGSIRHSQPLQDL